MKTYRGGELKLQMFLTSAIDGRRGQFHDPASLLLGQEHHVHTECEAVRAYKPKNVWRREIFRLPQIDPRFLGRQSRNLVIVSTDVCRLRLTCCLYMNALHNVVSVNDGRY
jgi:hypothetical protein